MRREYPQEVWNAFFYDWFYPNERGDVREDVLTLKEAMRIRESQRNPQGFYTRGFDEYFR